MDSSMWSARQTKFEAGVGAHNAASAAHSATACREKRRTQNWPRW
jgi:hypothetical protein